MRLTHGSTFSGIGAPEVAAAMLGWENVFHCEINPFGRQVLDYYFPNAKSYEDITKTDFSEWRGKIDVLTGGFPCQPFSYAGKRGGAEDDRYLWPYMLRCIEQVRPTWFVGENVSGITTMVLPGTETQMGSHSTLFGEGDTYTRTRQRYVIEEICSNLEAIGYSVQPCLIPACAVGAPHRRDRIFILAHNERDAQDSLHFRFKEGDEELGYTKQHGNTIAASRDGEIGLDASNTDRSRCSSPEWRGRPERTEMDGERKNESLFGSGRPCTPSTPPDTDNNGLQHSFERRCEGEETSTQRGRGEDGIPKRTESTSADGGGRLVADSDDSRLQETRTKLKAAMPAGEDSRSGDGWTIADTERRGSGTLSAQVRCGLADGERVAGSCSEWNAPDTISERPQAGHRRPQTCIKSGDTPDGHRSACSNDAGNDEQRRTDTYTESARPLREERRSLEGETKWQRVWRNTPGHDSTDVSARWRAFPTVSPICRGNDGLPFDVDNLSISRGKWRTESLKAYGNAIVPQVMYEIFSAIEATYD